jgi:hypothetical protein
MFRPLYGPSSACTLSYYKANYTINYAFVFVKEISFTSIKVAFKIITAAVELKSYSNINGINSIKSIKISNVVISGRGGDMISNWGYSCLGMQVSFCSFPW